MTSQLKRFRAAKCGIVILIAFRIGGSAYADGLTNTASADACAYGLGVVNFGAGCNSGSAPGNASGAGIGESYALGNGNVVANAFALANYGNLDLSLSLERGDPDPGYIGDGVTELDASASAFSGFSDTIKITGYNDGVGPIQIKPTFLINPQSFTVAGLNNADEGLLVEQSFFIEGVGQPLVSGQPISLTPGLYTFVGELQGGLDTTTPMAMEPNNQEHTTVVISGSADFYLDVLTPGASITSDSGHDYSSAANTPEPAYGWITAAVTAAICFVRRKRLRSLPR
jgi:hypothetical protein